MTPREMGIEEARSDLGNLVLDVIRGEVIVLTRYGKPVAAIVPLNKIKETETPWRSST